MFLSLHKKRNRELEIKVKERTILIENQRLELETQRDSLVKVNDEIVKQRENLIETNEIVNGQNEELRSQSDLLKEVYEEVMDQNKKIEEQANRLAEKNTLLTQSLNYARRIQNSLFPDIKKIRESLPKSAIFFQPKELVSGDFYWMRTVDDLIVVAEVDCTGHGVPGAFMSMIGNTLLNEIIVNKHILNPSDVFLKLNEELSAIFSHNDFDTEAQDDGMDLTLAVIDIKHKKIRITSAMQNFFITCDEDVQVYKGDIFSIGGLISRLKKPVYTTYEFNIVEGMRVFFSSDGFVDQFGELERDKFGVERFIQMLIKTKNKPLEEQFALIEKNFLYWKGTRDQMDDVLIFGIEF